MPLGLRRTLRLETTDVAGRLVTRIFIGNDEVPPSPELRVAVAQLAAGVPGLDSKRLVAAGILEVLEPVKVPDGLEVALHPSVAINFDLRPVSTTIPHADGPRLKAARPSGNLAIELFIPPFRLRPLHDLAARVRSRWVEILRRAAVEGVAVDRAAAAEELRTLAVQAVQSRPDLQPVLDVEGDRLVALGPLQDDIWHYPLGVLHVHADRRAAQARRTSATSVALDPDSDLATAEAELGQLGKLLGTLQHAVDGPEIARCLEGTSNGVQQLWRDLARANLVPDVGDRAGLGDDLEPGQIKHLGHCTLLANLGEAFVLVDPWLIPASATDAPAPPTALDLPRLAGVFLTHHRWDRVHLESLLKLDKTTPMFVPAQAGGPVVAKTARLLAAIGFESVTELESGQSVSIGEGTVTAAAHTGLDPTGLMGSDDSGARAMSLVMAHGGKACWLAGGGVVDREGGTAAAVASALQELHGPLAPVFATGGEERGTTCDYEWTFLLRPFAEWTAPTENGLSGPSALGELASASGTTQVVLYGQGGAPWYPGSSDAPDLVGIREALSAAGADLRQAVVGDVFTIGG